MPYAPGAFPSLYHQYNGLQSAHVQERLQALGFDIQLNELFTATYATLSGGARRNVTIRLLLPDAQLELPRNRCR
ncbi:MAG: hypothetical protein R2932_03030 [Caldilineaceae bacterium]